MQAQSNLRELVSDYQTIECKDTKCWKFEGKKNDGWIEKTPIIKEF